MDELSRCRSSVQCVGSREWRGSLQEAKGGVALEITSTEPFALHLIYDDALMGPGEKCDGVLISSAPPDGLACFIELKGAIDPADPDHPFRQVQGGIEHFAPLPGGTEHGETHHAAWRSESDLPQAPRGRSGSREIAVSANHVVAGAIVVVRGGTRHKSRWMDIAGRKVFVAVIQKHGHGARVSLSLEQIENDVR